MKKTIAAIIVSALSHSAFADGSISLGTIDVRHSQNESFYSVSAAVRDGKIEFAISDPKSHMQDSALKLMANGSFVSISSIDSNLSDVSTFSFKKQQTSYSIPVANDKNSCSAYYVSYYPSSDSFPISQAFIFDKQGKPAASMPQECSIPKIKGADNAAYMDGGYADGFYYSETYFKAGEEADFKNMFSYKGEPEFPKRSEFFAVKTDFSDFYRLEPNGDKPREGSYFKQIFRSPGRYFLIHSFRKEDGTSGRFVTKINVE